MSVVLNLAVFFASFWFSKSNAWKLPLACLSRLRPMQERGLSWYMNIPVKVCFFCANRERYFTVSDHFGDSEFVFLQCSNFLQHIDWILVRDKVVSPWGKYFNEQGKSMMQFKLNDKLDCQKEPVG